MESKLKEYLQERKRYSYSGIRIKIPFIIIDCPTLGNISIAEGCFSVEDREIVVYCQCEKIHHVE